MSDTPTVPAPSVPDIQSALTPLSNDAVQLEKEIASIVAAYKAGGASAAAALLPALAPELEKDWKDVETALPIIKAGYKTTEFWLVAAAMVGASVLFVMGKLPAIDASGLIGALTGIYTVVRMFAKQK